MCYLIPVEVTLLFLLFRLAGLTLIIWKYLYIKLWWTIHCCNDVSIFFHDFPAKSMNSIYRCEDISQQHSRLKYQSSRFGCYARCQHTAIIVHIHFFFSSKILIFSCSTCKIWMFNSLRHMIEDLLISIIIWICNVICPTVLM